MVAAYMRRHQAMSQPIVVAKLCPRRGGCSTLYCWLHPLSQGRPVISATLQLALERRKRPPACSTRLWALPALIFLAARTASCRLQTRNVLHERHIRQRCANV